MRAFTKRHRRALAEGRLRVELDDALRGRILRLLRRFDETWRTADESGWMYETSHLGELSEALCDLYGVEALPGTEGGKEVHGFLTGTSPAKVFDAIELFSHALADSRAFSRAVNNVFVDEESPWRMLDGELALLDPTFATDELGGRAIASLHGRHFDGASSELKRARHDLLEGHGRGAVHNAGSSYESVLKALLGTETGTAKKLLQELQRKGVFDDLPSRLRQPFIREVLMGLPWLRNELGGHGQGASAVEVPPAYAQLAIDLAAALATFLTNLEVDQQEMANEQNPPSQEPELVAATASGDDDIPF